MSGVGQSEEGVEASTSGMMETSMMESEDYYNPDDTSTWTQKEMSEQLCRICAKPNQYLIPIFEGEGIEHQLETKIQKHLPIEVSETDELPLQVCYQCASTLIAWNDLVIACIEADKKLRQALEHQEEDEDEKGPELFDDPALDSDEGEEPAQPSTSSATAISGTQIDTSPVQRSPGKAKKSKLHSALLKNPTAGPSGQKTPTKKTGAISKDDAVHEGTERFEAENIDDSKTQSCNTSQHSNIPAARSQGKTAALQIKEEICVINGLHFVTTSNGDEMARNNRCILCSADNMTLTEWKEHIKMHAQSKLTNSQKMTAPDIEIYPVKMENAVKPLIKREHIEPLDKVETPIKKKKSRVSVTKVNHIKFSKSGGDSKNSFLCTACGESSVTHKDLIRHIQKTCVLGGSIKTYIGKLKSLTENKGQVSDKTPTMIECYICNRIFSNTEGRKSQLKIHQGDLKKLCTKEVFTCNACIQRLNYHRTL